MNFTCLTLASHNAVATITLNRPEVHNAFNEILIAELTAAFESFDDNHIIRAIVLRGAGASFCAGADLNWMARMAEYSLEENLEDARALARLFAAISTSPKVTIACVEGAAIGGGAGLVAVCDLALALNSAKFALSEVRLGLVPSVIGPYVMDKVSIGAARALYVTGERISAAEAHRIGLVNEVVRSGEMEAALERKLELVLQAGPEAIRVAKELLHDFSNRMSAEAAELNARCIAELRVSPEGQEGIRAFLEKRKPHFSL